VKSHVKVRACFRVRPISSLRTVYEPNDVSHILNAAECYVRPHSILGLHLRIFPQSEPTIVSDPKLLRLGKCLIELGFHGIHTVIFTLLHVATKPQRRTLSQPGRRQSMPCTSTQIPQSQIAITSTLQTSFVTVMTYNVLRVLKTLNRYLDAKSHVG